MSVFPYAAAALVLTGAAFAASLATSQASPQAASPVAVTLATTQATTQAKPAPDPFVCELRLTEANRQVTIAAHAHASKPSRGIYQLEIEQRSSGGRATIRQGGEFDLKAGESVVLGEARFSGRAREFQAELSVTANGKSRTCRASPL
jgi:hypothetical protein